MTILLKCSQLIVCLLLNELKYSFELCIKLIDLLRWIYSANNYWYSFCFQGYLTLSLIVWFLESIICKNPVFIWFYYLNDSEWLQPISSNIFWEFISCLMSLMHLIFILKINSLDHFYEKCSTKFFFFNWNIAFKNYKLFFEGWNK